MPDELDFERPLLELERTLREASLHVTRPRLAVLAATSGFLVVLAGPLQAQKDSGIPAKADAKTVIHVLNRIAFGPRPGDEVARIR